ncbi:MAG: carbohydrate-binding family 9-like protein [Candidatus Omnitrophica bacterium]|nr:carbohydrate-binding family 9-like protein [Candidatus Omnitrophota bacterium]MCM8825246.1 carbohydrate-binding family 9-like protein [Candidatus Omnitrophota bacterium]
MLKRIQYRCPRIYEQINIDGILNENAWQKAECLEFFVPVKVIEPVSKTMAKLLYDEKNLYIGLKCFDCDIKATYTARDSSTWEEDVVELFIKTSTEGPGYYEFEFSPIKTIFDAFVPVSENNGKILEYSRWNCEGIKVETFISGTINDSSDFDDYWSIEISIPFAGLPTLDGRNPEKGEKWLFHVARYDYSYSLRNSRELCSCACLTNRNFHNINEWLLLLFD